MHVNVARRVFRLRDGNGWAGTALAAVRWIVEPQQVSLRSSADHAHALREVHWFSSNLAIPW